MTNRHTLVIPTFNRPDLLRRLVRYYQKRFGSMYLLVLDSSKSEIAEANAKALSPFGKSVRHVVFPETEPVVSKLMRGLDLVQTPYASFCADDDLVFPEGLQKTLAFLTSHPDYVCVHGLYVNFRLTGREVRLGLEYAGPSNEAAHPGARIFRLFQKYESLFYAVFRTQDLRDIFSVVPVFPTIHYQELFQSVAALIKGKVRRLPVLYAARQSGPPADSERKKWQTFDWFAENPSEVLEHYRAYCGETWKFYGMYSQSPQLDRDAFYKTMDLAHAVYFAAGCIPAGLYSAVQQYWPEDPYVKIANEDLIGQLRSPLGRDRPDFVRIFSRIRRVLQFVWFFPDFVRLNLDVKRNCRVPWKFHLHPALLPLVAIPEFRKALLELFFYLDES